MSVYSDEMIMQWCSDGGVSRPELCNIGPSSIDLPWSGCAKIARPNGFEELPEMDTLTLEPWKFYLLDTAVTVRLPDSASGSIYMRSSWARLGLNHHTAGYIDPAFYGTITLEIVNTAPWRVDIIKHDCLVQMELRQLLSMPSRTYQDTGRYNGQSSPQEAIA